MGDIGEYKDGRPKVIRLHLEATGRTPAPPGPAGAPEPAPTAPPAPAAQAAPA